MCINCIRSQVDITEGVQKQVVILFCKFCSRYLQPPKHWVRADLESKELLTFCIKRIRGLQKVKLVDAGFIWTEPHSRRLKAKLAIQKEVFNGAIMQQSFVVDYTVEDHVCPDCHRSQANPNAWVACVQLRQHVYHKRTFLFLEQLIIKHNADAQCINIKDIHEGVDFFFPVRGNALKFIDFLQQVVPIKFRHDKQLVSHDTKSNTYNYKYTFSVEIAPICKDDLIMLPPKAVPVLSNIGPLVLCSRVTNQLSFIDPITMRTASIDAQGYFRYEFKALASQRQLVEYIVLDIELSDQHQTWGQGPQGSANGATTPGGSRHGLMADVTVARSSDFGRNDNVIHARTHLGHLLHVGDTALGYDLANANLVGLDLEAFINKGGQLPDVVLVRKSFEEKRRRRRAAGGGARPWKLKTLNMEVDDESSGARGNRGANMEEDREKFMQELEEDPDLRSRINIYKDEVALAQVQAAAAGKPAAAVPRGLDEMDDDDDDGEELPQIPLEELLDDLIGLDIGEEGEEEAPGGQDEDMMEH